METYATSDESASNSNDLSPSVNLDNPMHAESCDKNGERPLIFFDLAYYGLSSPTEDFGNDESLQLNGDSKLLWEQSKHNNTKLSTDTSTKLPAPFSVALLKQECSDSSDASNGKEVRAIFVPKEANSVKDCDIAGAEDQLLMTAKDSLPQASSKPKDKIENTNKLKLISSNGSNQKAKKAVSKKGSNNMGSTVSSGRGKKQTKTQKTPAHGGKSTKKPNRKGNVDERTRKGLEHEAKTEKMLQRMGHQLSAPELLIDRRRQITSKSTPVIEDVYPKQHDNAEQLLQMVKVTISPYHQRASTAPGKSKRATSKDTKEKPISSRSKKSFSISQNIIKEAAEMKPNHKPSSEAKHEDNTEAQMKEKSLQPELVETAYCSENGARSQQQTNETEPKNVHGMLNSIYSGLSKKMDLQPSSGEVSSVIHDGEHDENKAENARRAYRLSSDVITEFSSDEAIEEILIQENSLKGAKTDSANIDRHGLHHEDIDADHGLKMGCEEKEEITSDTVSSDTSESGKDWKRFLKTPIQENGEAESLDFNGNIRKINPDLQNPKKYYESSSSSSDTDQAKAMLEKFNLSNNDDVQFIGQKQSLQNHLRFLPTSSGNEIHKFAEINAGNSKEQSHEIRRKTEVHCDDDSVDDEDSISNFSLKCGNDVADFSKSSRHKVSPPESIVRDSLSFDNEITEVFDPEEEFELFREISSKEYGIRLPAFDNEILSKNMPPSGSTNSSTRSLAPPEKCSSDENTNMTSLLSSSDLRRSKSSEVGSSHKPMSRPASSRAWQCPTNNADEKEHNPNDSKDIDVRANIPFQRYQDSMSKSLKFVNSLEQNEHKEDIESVKDTEDPIDSLKVKDAGRSVSLTEQALRQHNQIHNKHLDIEGAADHRHYVAERENQQSRLSYMSRTTDYSIITDSTFTGDPESTACKGWKRGRELGHGAYGTVYEGLTADGKLIAVKLVELTVSNRDIAIKEYNRVRGEIDLLKTLQHKNIVRLLDCCFDGACVHIFMEHVPGGSIKSVLSQYGALKERIFRKYTKQILEGLSYLHGSAVVHRDIKGSNVMLMTNGTIKLIDFGCAKRLRENSIMNDSQASHDAKLLRTMLGTPYWMAPEVITSQGHGSKSDIWSVGATVYEMATTQPPLRQLEATAAMFHIGNGNKMPELPTPEFSRSVSNFVRKCFEWDQDKRPSASQLLNHRFVTHQKVSKLRVK